LAAGGQKSLKPQMNTDKRRWEKKWLAGALLLMADLPVCARQAVQQPQQAAQQATSSTAQPENVDSSAQAASTPVVALTTGQVQTQSGVGVAGATVRITNTDSHKVWLSWTDEGGKFSFPQLPAGYYHIEVSQLGFVPTADDIKLPVIPPGPIPVVMNVATLVQLSAAEQAATAQNPSPASASTPGTGTAQNPPTNGSNGANASNAPNTNVANAQSAANQGSQQSGQQGQQPAQGRFGGRSGRGQLPAGITNALQQGMGSTGFESTDLTGQGAGGQQNESVGQGAENTNASVAVSNAGAGGSSDSFLLQGTVGQGAAMNGPGGFGGPVEFGGPGGPGGPGLGGLTPSTPGGGSGVGGFGGPGGGGFGGGGFGGPGGRAGGGPGGGPGGGGAGPLFQFSGPPPPGGGSIFAGRSRLARQAINRLRWGFYDQYSNSALDAKPYSITGQEFPKISNYNEQFGGNLGGALKIPHIYNGSDRTFFFVNYEHRLVKNGVNDFSLVPTSDERQGNFCNVGNGFTLYSPYSNFDGPRTALGTNGCDISSMINSASAGLMQFIPQPNIATTAGPEGQSYNYLLQATTPSNTDLVNFHILHTINSKWNLNGGYNLNSVRANTLGIFPSLQGTSSTLSQNVTIGLNHNWTPSMVESTSVNWSRNRAESLSANSFKNDIAGELGITGVSTDPINYGIPEIQFSSLGSLNDPVPSLTRNQTLRFIEAWTYTHGKHTVKYGAEVRRIQLNTTSDPNPRGRFLFTGQMTSQLDATGASLETSETQPYYEFADFLLGLPYNTQLRTGDANTYFRNWEFIGYGQDDWRLTKTFSVLLGVRYSGVTPPAELFDHISNLDLNSTATAVEVLTPNETGSADGAYPRALIHGDYTNWAPRIGFAWRPPIKPTTVVRGGYSIFYNDSIYSTLAQNYLAYQPPFAESANLYTTAAQTLTLQTGFPNAGAGLLCTPSTPLATNPTCTVPNTSGVNPFYRDASAQIWMLSTETDIRPNWILTLTYTGTKGTDLDLLRAPNRAPLGTNPFATQTSLQIPYATSFDYDQSGADSLYNALQVRLVHRFTHGFTMQVFYTFSKSLDDASSIGGTSPIVVQNDQNFRGEWGLSTFDMRHQVRLMSVWELPLGERHRYLSHGWENRVFGNWRLQNLVTWHTGNPFTAYLGGGASNNSGTGANFSERAEQEGDPNVGICGGSALDFFNTSAFATPTQGTYGNERRGAIEGPCSFSWNVSLAKSFRFGPRERQHHVDVRWEVQNLTNTPSFTGISTTFGSAIFGQVTAAGAMRTMDAVVRFNF